MSKRERLQRLAYQAYWAAKTPNEERFAIILGQLFGLGDSEPQWRAASR